MDILIADESGQKLFSIQVKTRLTKSGWPMSLKHESIAVDRLFYVFVDLSGSLDDAPEYFVVPSAKIAWVVKANHQAWLRNSGREGRKRNDSDRRVIKPDYSSIFTDEAVDPRLGPDWMEAYRSAWHVFADL